MEQDLIPVQPEVLGYEPTKIFHYACRVFTLYDSIKSLNSGLLEETVGMPLVVRINSPNGLFWSIEVERGKQDDEFPISRIKGSLYGVQGRTIQGDFVLVSSGLFIPREVIYEMSIHLISNIIIDFRDQCRINLYSFVLHYCFNFLKKTNSLGKLSPDIFILVRRILQPDQIAEFNSLIFRSLQIKTSSQVHP